MSQRKTLTVLLLEDDDADAYLSSRALLGLPRVANVVRARNGQDAVSMLTSSLTAPDIIFVDLQMPTMDGLQFLGACMNESLAKVPLVVLTSSSDWKDATRSRVNGAVLVITKPENPSDLARALYDAIQTFVPEAVEVPRKVFDLPTRSSRPAYEPAPRPAAAPTAPRFGRREPRPG